MNLTHKYTTFFLKKMYHYAGADYDKDSPKEVMWNPDQIYRFRMWMIDYLKTHRVAREVVMKDPSKKKVENLVDFYIKNYGFNLKL